MPSVGLGRTFVHQLGTMEYGNNAMEDRCECCPYGYHIDLDFVPFTKKMLSREGDYERLKQLKDKWRSDRQSMDKLLGVDSTPSKIWDASEPRTLSRASKDVWRERSAWKSRKTNLDLDGGGGGGSGSYTGLSSSSELLLENGLSEAVTDFEEALQRTRPQSKILSYDIPDSQKFHTFPRIKPPSVRDPVTGLSTVGSIFSTRGTSVSSTTTSSSTVIMRDSLIRPLSREVSKMSQEEDLSDLEPTVRARVSRTDVNLNVNVNDRGLGDANIDISELERRVKLIPELETQVKALTAEKRQLQSQLEAERSKSASLETNLANSLSSTAPLRKSTRDTGVQKTVLTRDVGVTHIMPRTRTIAVGGNTDMSTFDRTARGDSSSPTGSSTSTLRRRLKTFETGVQVNDFDFPDSDLNRSPVLQIVEGIDCGVQVDFGFDDKLESAMKAPPRRKHTGIMAKPSTSDVGVSNKPTLRDYGSGMDVEPPIKPRVKHVGVSAALDAIDTAGEKAKITNRAISTNTDKLRTSSVGSNTMVDAKPRLTSSFVQTDVQTTESSDTILPTGIVKKIMTLPISPTASPSNIPQKSPAELKGMSRIPRLASPVGSPVVPPRLALGVRSTPNLERAESPVSPSSSGTHSPCPAESLPTFSYSHKKPNYQRSDTYTKDMYIPERPHHFGTLEPLEEEDREGREARSSSASSSSGFVPPQEKREKVSPSKEMQAALKVLNDALLRGKTTQQVTNAISIILHEWFRIAGTKTANPFDVEDYLDSFEIYSPQLLRYIVNMPDGNGNTALHYAVSHGNFDVVSILLDSKVCDPNKANKAGYTSIMLVALANISCEAHRQVVRRLFSLGDVNIKAGQHGQTALMLGASHGRFDTVRLLLEAGADINIQDEDGSTGLMCAAEHGHMKIVKYLMAHPDCDPHLTDNDGSTAFSIAMEGSHKDIGVLLYAQMHFTGQRSSPLAHKSRSTTPSASSQNSTASSSAHTSPLAAKRQQSDSSLLSKKPSSDNR